MALTNVSLFGGAFLTPVLVGKITHSLNWQWTFYLVAIFTGVALPIMFFFVPETAFRRPDYLNTDFTGESDRGRSRQCSSDQSDIHPASVTALRGNGRVNPDQGTVSEKGHLEAHDGKSPQETIPAKQSYWQTLRLFTGRKTDESFFKLLLRPFPLFLHPGILWVSDVLSRPLLPGDLAQLRILINDRPV
jgi:MFS family permease